MQCVEPGHLWGCLTLKWPDTIRKFSPGSKMKTSVHRKPCHVNLNRVQIKCMIILLYFRPTIYTDLYRNWSINTRAGTLNSVQYTLGKSSSQTVMWEHLSLRDDTGAGWRQGSISRVLREDGKPQPTGSGLSETEQERRGIRGNQTSTLINPRAGKRNT